MLSLVLVFSLLLSAFVAIAVAVSDCDSACAASLRLLRCNVLNRWSPWLLLLLLLLLAVVYFGRSDAVPGRIICLFLHLFLLILFGCPSQRLAGEKCERYFRLAQREFNMLFIFYASLWHYV